MPPERTRKPTGIAMGMEGGAEAQRQFSPETHTEYVRLLAQLWLPTPLRRKLDASDIVQDVLLVAHDKKNQFRGESEGQYKAWLRQITRNQVLDTVKKRRLPEQSVQQVADASRCTENWLAADGSSVGSRVAREELLNILAESLARLSDEWREVLVLHYLRGLQVPEIAEYLGRSRASVAGLLRRALAALREDSRLIP